MQEVYQEVSDNGHQWEVKRTKQDRIEGNVELWCFNGASANPTWSSKANLQNCPKLGVWEDKERGLYNSVSTSHWNGLPWKWSRTWREGGDSSQLRQSSYLPIGADSPELSATLPEAGRKGLLFLQEDWSSILHHPGKRPYTSLTLNSYFIVSIWGSGRLSVYT